MDRKTSVIAVSNETGLDRRELLTDARDISSNTDDGELSPEEYELQLQQRGLEKLSENIVINSFEGQSDTVQLYQYGRDFFMGDIVQIRNEYGIEAKSRIVEIVRSIDKEGFDIYPTFSIFESLQNLIEPEDLINWEQGLLNASNGLPASGSNRIRSQFITNGISENTKYIVSTNSQYMPLAVHFYTDDIWISRVAGGSSNIVDFTTPTGCKRIRFVVSKNDNSNLLPDEITNAQFQLRYKF